MENKLDVLGTLARRAIILAAVYIAAQMLSDIASE